MPDSIENEKSLSLLGQIVTEVEKMDDVQKQSLLIQLRSEELLQKAKALDAQLVPGSLTDEEIIAFCKQVHKEHHARR